MSDIDYTIVEKGGILTVDGVKVEVGGVSPVGFWIRDALNRRVIVKTRDRRKAQQVINEIYGSGKYTVANGFL